MNPDVTRVVLGVVDVQQRLVPAMAEFGPALRNMLRLIRGLQLMGRPVLVTEQYPQGLGPTLPSISRLVPGPYPTKLHFSCYGAPEFVGAVSDQDLVLCGIEAHVCVLQTALSGLERGQRVFVAADAVASRLAANRDHALRQMAAAGVVVASSETLLFAMLEHAGNDAFKAVSRLVR